MTFSIECNIHAERVRCSKVEFTHFRKAQKSGLLAVGCDQKENGKKQFTMEEISIICQMPGTNPDCWAHKPYLRGFVRPIVSKS